MKKKAPVWPPNKIYLTRDGWNDSCPEEGEYLWCEDRISKKDIVYVRLRRKKFHPQLRKEK